MEAHALQQQGWTISAIARHLRRNRRTVRNYLNGVTEPGARKKPEVDPFQEYVEYITLRLTADPHVEARTLCDELEDLGYTQSYQTLTRQIRARGLRPICPQCVSATCRPNAVIEHPPVKKHNGIGSIYPIHPQRGDGARTRTCWWGRWPTRDVGEATSPPT